MVPLLPLPEFFPGQTNLNFKFLNLRKTSVPRRWFGSVLCCQLWDESRALTPDAPFGYQCRILSVFSCEQDTEDWLVSLGGGAWERKKGQEEEEDFRVC